MAINQGFSVTYERWDEDDLEAGETDDHGYIVRNVRLRDAIEEIGQCDEASSWPFDGSHDVWFTNTEANDGTREFYETGTRESRSFHMPRNLTPSTRRRIARLLGVRIGRPPTIATRQGS